MVVSGWMLVRTKSFWKVYPSSVGVMDEPAQVGADSNRKYIWIERNGAAVIKSEVQVRSRLDVGGGVEAVVAGEVCAPAETLALR